jgi:hypothetical protein
LASLPILQPQLLLLLLLLLLLPLTLAPSLPLRIHRKQLGQRRRRRTLGQWQLQGSLLLP